VAKASPARQSPDPEKNGSHRPNEGSEVFQALLDSLNVGIASVLPSGVILYCNPRFRDILGISSTRAILGTELRYLISAGSWPSLQEALTRGSEYPVDGELQLQGPDRKHFVSLSLAPLCFADVTIVRIVAEEKTKLVETSKALNESQAELHSLSARILQLRDNERRRIARDLHDVTGQELAVVLMTLGSVSHRFDQGSAAHDRIKESIDILHKVESEIRTLSYLLHPPLLDESGLTAALQWYVQGLEKRTGLHFHLHVDSLPRLTRDREIALFRVVQESLTNVIRHADATNVWIRSAINGKNLELYIEDDGRGISPQKVSLTRKGYTGGVGIAGMDQRLRQLGGRLRVSPTGHGTVVCASAPITSVQTEESPALPHRAPQTSPPTGPEASLVKRILIVDDHEVTRRGIRALLADEKDLEICGEASNGSDAIAQAFGLHPDLIILDLIMPQVGGLSVATHLRHAGLNSKILVFSTHSFPGIEKTVQAAGCEGYVFKQDASQELVRAVREVLHGSTYFQKNAASPEV
jgi:signal transduction histidine kinase/CheY-like chemotaxis protein